MPPASPRSVARGPNSDHRDRDSQAGLADLRETFSSLLAAPGARFIPVTQRCRKVRTARPLALAARERRGGYLLS